MAKVTSVLWVWCKSQSTRANKPIKYCHIHFCFGARCTKYLYTFYRTVYGDGMLSECVLYLLIRCRKESTSIHSSQHLYMKKLYTRGDGCATVKYDLLYTVKKDRYLANTSYRTIDCCYPASRRGSRAREHDYREYKKTKSLRKTNHFRLFIFFFLFFNMLARVAEISFPNGK